jgi:hypothetical protein
MGGPGGSSISFEPLMDCMGTGGYMGCMGTGGYMGCMGKGGYMGCMGTGGYMGCIDIIAPIDGTTVFANSDGYAPKLTSGPGLFIECSDDAVAEVDDDDDDDDDDVDGIDDDIFLLSLSLAFAVFLLADKFCKYSNES